MTNALTVICLFNEHNLTLSRDEGIALYRAILPECEKEGNKSDYSTMLFQRKRFLKFKQKNPLLALVVILKI
jgi:hypothetical protein